jgi:hypothetical protein
MSTSRLVGFLLATEARDNPTPKPPTRPIACPRCRSGDVHGERPCPLRLDLEQDVSLYRHDWHCHTCRWSAHIGDGRPT